MNIFSQKLRQLRMERGMVQRELAEIAGIKIRAYQLYEQGKTEPNIDVLIKFADVFNVTLDELVGREFIPRSREVFSEESQIDPLKNPNV